VQRDQRQGPGSVTTATSPPSPRGRTVGVEEELLLVDGMTGAARCDAAPILTHLEQQHLAGCEQETTVPAQVSLPAGSGSEGEPVPHGGISGEFQQQQLETATPPVRRLDHLHAELRQWRRAAEKAAAFAGARVAALATSPLAVVPQTTDHPRYQAMRQRFGLTAVEQLTCGCHVHVSVDSDAEGVGVLDRIRVWLPTLLAISANSPFWQGADSGFASFRSQAWNRWPSAGPTDIFGSAAAYRGMVEAMVASQVPLDQRMIYFDARLSPRYPTVEVRVADVCLHADDAVLLAGLTRGLVETAAQEWQCDVAPPPVPTALLRLAAWRAGRSALDDELLHPYSSIPQRADSILWALYDHVHPALQEAGDAELVADLLIQLGRRGTGARRQRAVMAQTADLTLVVQDAISQTQL
jgi:carboxylate-amine ligase